MRARLLGEQNMRIANETRVYLSLGSTDMRKCINGLSLLVADKFEQDAFSGMLFVFCSRNRRIIKILYWDWNGFCLWQKRLEKSKFIWPKSEQEVLELNYKELSWLLDGLDPFTLKGHDKLQYTEIY